MRRLMFTTLDARYGAYSAEKEVTTGRTQIIADILAEMTPADRRELMAFADRFARAIKSCNPAVQGMGPEATLELIWELLIFCDDPRQVNRDSILNRYRAAAR